MSNYLTKEEMAWDDPDHVDIQIAIGLRTCKTIAQVKHLLKDVREHERRLCRKAEKAPEPIKE